MSFQCLLCCQNGREGELGSIVAECIYSRQNVVDLNVDLDYT